MIRFSLTIEYTDPLPSLRGNNLRQWIKDLKKADEAVLQRDQRQENVRQRHIAVVTQKGPEFWNQLIEYLIADAQVLQKEFPHHPNRNVKCQRENQTTFVLKRNTFPSVEMKAELQPDLLRVSLVISTRNNHAALPRSRSEEMVITVDGNNVLHFEYDDQPYIDPGDLAQKLLETVTDSNQQR